MVVAIWAPKQVGSPGFVDVVLEVSAPVVELDDDSGRLLLVEGAEFEPGATRPAKKAPTTRPPKASVTQAFLMRRSPLAAPCLRIP